MARVLKNGRIITVPDWPSPLPVIKADQVKQEAGRRIVAIAPEWQQRNMLARIAELLRIGETNLNAAEQAELAAIEGLWATIKGIRAKSNALEAMDPIPVDDTNDKDWT